MKPTVEEVADPIRRAERKDMFDRRADTPTLEQRSATNTWFTQARSSAWLENTLRKQAASISALVDNALRASHVTQEVDRNQAWIPM